LFFKVIERRIGKFLTAEVIGATKIVFNILFEKFGDITKQGRVFLISLPTVGSKFTQ
jgi:hypothetical protein